MRRLVRDHTGRVRAGVRGIAFLWTILIALPLMFFGLAMAVDITRVVMAGREMSTATHASALAAAYQFNTGAATIHPTRARQAAVETMCVAVEHGAIKNAVPARTGTTPCVFGGGPVAVNVTLVSPQVVQVSARYRVDNLLLLSYFDYGTVDQEVTRTAAVCDPRDRSGPTGGYCTRPSY